VSCINAGVPPNKFVGRERREREVSADFQLSIVDLIRAARQLNRSRASLCQNGER